MDHNRPSVNLALRVGRGMLANITSLPDYAYKAAAIIAKCRSPEMGTHTVECRCGRILDEVNSCRHRFCPLCSVGRANQWLAKWTARLFSVDHWHLVFTVPHHLNFFFQHYPAQMGEIFFAAVSQTLTKLFADPQWLGGRVGALAMLQSWDNENKYHPHMHILLTSGGANKSGAWIGMKRGPKFLMPHLVISRMFRAIFMDLFRKAEYSGAIKAPAGTSFSKRMKFIEAVKEKAFVVEICGPYSHGEGVLKYFAGHVRGGPIPNSRVVSVSSTLVTFLMKPRPHLADLKLTLDLETFLSRLLSHMPPPGLHIVRAYGLYSPSSKVKVTGLPANDSNKDAIPDDPTLLCPRCRRPMIVRDRGDILPNISRPTRRSVFARARASPKAAVA